MSTLIDLQNELHQLEDMNKAINIRKFFKNSKDDIFLGISAAILRKIAKRFFDLSLQELLVLMQSGIHDERAISHIILCLKYKKGDDEEQAKIYNFYLKYRNYIRDWDGVDDTAPYIVGPYLLKKDKAVLYELAKSNIIWDRRIAIVSTWWFIRQNEFTDALNIAEILLYDTEDLIHKASGWMLREIGKRNLSLLKQFLNKHYKVMPRTMLRYSIEKLLTAERKYYLTK